MEIQSIPSLLPVQAPDSQQNSAQSGISSFKDLLDQALQSVDALQRTRNRRPKAWRQEMPATSMKRS